MSKIHGLLSWHALAVMLVLASLLTVMIPVPTVRAADTVVTFPDPHLEAAIREHIGKPAGDIYESDLVGLTSLRANREGIHDLTGLEHCTGLTLLHLYGNGISDLSPLSTLTSLRTLWLMDNLIGDISPLSGLNSLYELDLYKNRITDLSPLSSLNSLRYLYLDSNQISDLSPLSGLSNLGILELDRNEISDLSALSGLTRLITLTLGRNDIADISPLAGLTNLWKLSLEYNQTSDLSPLAGMTSLHYLYLTGNEITDIRPLAELTDLRCLDLGGNGVGDLTPLLSLNSLVELHLGGNRISDVSPLAGLANLGYLELFGNRISDLSPLSRLFKLRTLYLGSNQISDLSPLSDLAELGNLDLNKNQISDLSPLSELGNLYELQLYYNQVADLEPLAGLTHLWVLNLTANHISDIEPLVNNAGIGSGDEVSLEGNPLNSTSWQVLIPQLQARGATVYWDTMNQMPDQPNNVSPLDGGVGVDLTPVLESSTFSDPDANDVHGASQWQISIVSDNYSDPIFDTGTDVLHLASIAVPPSNLDFATTYYWHVRHQDNRGDWSEWSVGSSFTTVTSPGEAIPPAAVADLTATAAADNGVTLTWTSPGDDNTTGTASTYDIRYFTAAITDSNWGSASQCSSEPAPAVAGSAETFTVTGLAPDTTYYFAIKAADEVPNWSALSNVVSKRTEAKDTTDPTVMLTSPVVSPTNTSPIPVTATFSEAVSGFTIEDVVVGNGAASDFVAVSTTVYTFNITPSGQGAVTVDIAAAAAHDAAGNGSAAAPQYSIDYVGPAPDGTAPSLPQVTDDGESTAGTTEIHAIWSASDPESGIAQYQYAVGTTAGGTDVVGWTPAGTATETTVAGLSLTAGQTYYMSVKAQNGQGLWSEVGSSNGITVSADDADSASEKENKAGMPFWGWIIVGVGGMAVIATGLILWRPTMRKPAPAASH